MNLAPIVLFVYNRPKHTLHTLEALSKNELASESTLYIYADGPKLDAEQNTIDSINETRQLIRKKNWCKEVIIKEATNNKGLAPSVIAGVTEVIEQHGKVIVLEDDLLTSTYFLNFMNSALKKYKNIKEVKQISGYCFPINQEGNGSAIFFPLTTTWGWAMWKDRWEVLDFECKDYQKLKGNNALAHKFDLEGSYKFTKMFINQMESQGKISSWGIRLWWNVFNMNGVVLYPDLSLIKNIGWDGTGRHGENYEVFTMKHWNPSYKIISYPNELTIASKEFEKVKRYMRTELSLSSRVVKKIKSMFRLRR